MAEKARKSKEAHEERERRQRAKERRATEQQRQSPLKVISADKSPQPPRKEYASGQNSSKDSTDDSRSPQAIQNEASVDNPGTDVSQIPSAIVPSSPDFVSKLQLEVQLMLRLDHPHIVKVYQVIDTEDECFIVM